MENLASLSVEVTTLADKISQKSKELDALKAQYQKKLQDVHALEKKYLKALGKIENEDTSVQLPEVLCQHCGKAAFEATNEHYFVLYPKEQIEQVPQPAPVKVLDIKSKPKSKKIFCSYCKEPGHSRARCPKKLGTEVNTSGLQRRQ